MKLGSPLWISVVVSSVRGLGVLAVQRSLRQDKGTVGPRQAFTTCFIWC